MQHKKRYKSSVRSHAHFMRTKVPKNKFVCVSVWLITS